MTFWSWKTQKFQKMNKKKKKNFQRRKLTSISLKTPKNFKVCWNQIIKTLWKKMKTPSHKYKNNFLTSKTHLIVYAMLKSEFYSFTVFSKRLLFILLYIFLQKSVISLPSYQNVLFFLTTAFYLDQFYYLFWRIYFADGLDFSISL